MLLPIRQALHLKMSTPNIETIYLSNISDITKCIKTKAELSQESGKTADPFST